MKLRNKKTGEIMDTNVKVIEYPNIPQGYPEHKLYNSLAELNEEWEDVPEESQEDGLDHIITLVEAYSSVDEEYYPKEIVEKLKAFKRLKDKGFRFEGIKEDYTRILQSQDPFRTGKRYLQFNKSEDEGWMKENWEDLDLLFGGEE